MLKLTGPSLSNTDYDFLMKQWRFPCGESGIRIEKPFWGEGLYEIEMKWEGNDDLFNLAQLVDALRSQGVDQIDLNVPYFPYSRQDRRCQPGEGHSLKVVGQFINSLGFRRVYTKDGHSAVLEAVVDRLRNQPQEDCAFWLPVYDYLIAPDAGAAKKAGLHGQVVCGNTHVLYGTKERLPGGGMELTFPQGASAAVANKRVCVVDDLCDGGATFISTALALVVPGFDRPAVLDLYVTHGFFTKGLEDLKRHYDTIYTNNLMRPEFRGHVKEI